MKRSKAPGFAGTIRAGFLMGSMIAATLMASVAAQGQEFQELFSNNVGAHPWAGVTLGNDGNFYGTTYIGGAAGGGTVFRVTPGGTLTTVVSFNGTNGANPEAGLTLGNDGNFYGTTYQGGAGGGENGYGTVFRVAPDGTLTTVVTFNGPNGVYPQAGLTLGSDGNFYGTTSGGGANGYGTVFRMTPEGTLTTLASFNATNGASPRAGVTFGNDGNLYGTTYEEGAKGYGTVFQVTPQGTLTTLVNFNGTNGANPEAGLTLGPDGNFYGTTVGGGSNGDGTVFQVTPGGTLTTFSIATGGAYPQAGLTLGSDGNFYGTMQNGGAKGDGTVFKVTPGGTLTPLASFNGTNGMFPQAGLTLGGDGNFYGTTYYGGIGNAGTIFKVTPGGTLTTLVSFNSPDGVSPEALTLGSDGNFYGTTYADGANGYGTVFQVTPGGTLTTLVSFNGTNGANPQAGLILGNDGNFYGTTYAGGASNAGTVFQLTLGGTLTTLVSFNGTNGSFPQAGLTLGNDGNFYGTTYYGGANNDGTAFQMTPGGTLTTLVNFNSTNGAYPQGGLTLGSDGNFYGTTVNGGANTDGTVFRMTPEGALTTLVSFTSLDANGIYPKAGLTLGGDGNFYGTTYEDGAYGGGTVFRVTPGGTLTTLVGFNSTNATDGAYPQAGLTLGRDGNFYGTTPKGGANGFGTVFKVTPGGTLTTLYSFDGSTAVAAQCSPTFGLDGNLYGTANEMVIWRLIIPAPPTVATGLASAMGVTGVTISGTLTPNGVNTSGAFEYGVSTAYGNTIAATPATVSGSSTITPVSAVLGGLLPHTLYHYRLDGTNAKGTNYGSDATFTTLNTPPTAGSSTAFVGTGTTVALTLPFPTTDADGDQVTIQSVSASAGAPFTLGIVSGKTVEVTGGINETGRGIITYTVTDGFGGTASGTVEVTVGGAIFGQFGVPQTGAVAGSIESGTRWISSVFSSNGNPLLEEGGGVPGLSGAAIAGLSQPSGDVVLVRLVPGKGGITRQNDVVLVAGLSSGTPSVLVQTGKANGGLPGGVTIKSFLAIDGTGTDAFFLVALQGVGVTPKNRVALCSRSGGGLNILARTGDKVNGKTVLQVTTLVGSVGTLADGRWRVDDTHIGVRLTFSDASEAIYTIPATSASPTDWTLLAQTGASAASGLGGATIKSFGLPGFGPQNCAVVAHLAVVSGGQVTSANNAALLTATGSSQTLLVRKGDAVAADANGKTLTGAKIGGFGDPIVGASGRVAFLFTASEPANEASLAQLGQPAIGYSSDGTTWSVLANVGATAPSGGHWLKFLSLVLPKGANRGPIFSGTLKPIAADGVSVTDNLALWAVNSSGTLQVLFSDADSVTAGGANRVVRTFTALTPATTVGGAASGYDDDGHVVVKATFKDILPALLNIPVP